MAGAAPTTSDRGELERLKKELTEHMPHHVTKAEIHRQIHGSSAAGRFNAWLAVHITSLVGTMWAAYVFAFISFVSLPAALAALQKGDMLTFITWLSQSFLQLVLLPIIIVGQNVISTAQDARAEHDHETLTVLHRINVQQLKMLEQQQRILDQLETQESSSKTAAG